MSQTTKTLEEFILSSDRKDFLSKLIPNTKEHSLFTLYNAFSNSNGKSLSKKDQVLLDAFFNKNKYGDAKNLKLRSLFVDY